MRWTRVTKHGKYEVSIRPDGLFEAIATIQRHPRILGQPSKNHRELIDLCKQHIRDQRDGIEWARRQTAERQWIEPPRVNVGRLTIGEVKEWMPPSSKFQKAWLPPRRYGILVDAHDQCWDRVRYLADKMFYEECLLEKSGPNIRYRFGLYVEGLGPRFEVRERDYPSPTMRNEFLRHVNVLDTRWWEFTLADPGWPAEVTRSKGGSSSPIHKTS